MAYTCSVDIFDISRSMFKYPWLEYPGRNKGEVGMDRNAIKGRGLKRKKLPGSQSQAGPWVNSANPWEGSRQALGHFDGSPQPSR